MNDTALAERPKAVAKAPKANMGPLTKLAPKHRLLIDYMTAGCPHSFITKMVRAAPTEFDREATRPLQQNEPLTLEEAADALGIRRRHARHLFEQSLFRKELTKAANAVRDSVQIAALLKTIEIMNNPGDGSAAWAKVNLTAAQSLLEQPGEGGPKVSVTVNNAVQMNAGLVIRLPPGVSAPPLEQQTIDLEASDDSE